MEALISALVPLVLPAAEHALGIDAPIDAKKQWVLDGVTEILEHMVFAKLKLPSWAASLEPKIEEIVSKELAALLAKAEVKQA